jgi:hypothetical protein
VSALRLPSYHQRPCHVENQLLLRLLLFLLFLLIRHRASNTLRFACPCSNSASNACISNSYSHFQFASASYVRSEETNIAEVCQQHSSSVRSAEDSPGFREKVDSQLTKHNLLQLEKGKHSEWLAHTAKTVVIFKWSKLSPPRLRL